MSQSMPRCKKCGAQISEGAELCSTCAPIKDSRDDSLRTDEGEDRIVTPLRAVTEPVDFPDSLSIVVDCLCLNALAYTIFAVYTAARSADTWGMLGYAGVVGLPLYLTAILSLWLPTRSVRAWQYIKGMLGGIILLHGALIVFIATTDGASIISKSGLLCIASAVYHYLILRCLTSASACEWVRLYCPRCGSYSIRAGDLWFRSGRCGYCWLEFDMQDRVPTRHSEKVCSGAAAKAASVEEQQQRP